MIFQAILLYWEAKMVLSFNLLMNNKKLGLIDLIK